ncbi:MAG TPA: SUMF1/EgtB/PvdO family nonheme iron enzyme, partial [Povalibacter sp.]|nr:SUMF1/EgtB/PvdO family nonheme iron enzyme [Povalibacter sp.]
DARDKEKKRLAELAALKQKLVDQATANEVAAATATLRDLRASLSADDPFLETAPKAVANAYVRLAALAARSGRPDSAVSFVDRALELDRNNAQIPTLREQYLQQVAAKSAATPSTPTQQAPSPTTQVASAQTQQQVIAAPVAQPGAQTTAPGTTCTAALAGYGTRSRGVCFDPMTGGRGPELVVVPAGTGAAKPFAVTRFEVSAAEYGAFCQQSGKCRSQTAQADLPVTAISAADAQQYADWLSTATGFVYRLPTDAEWSYVAGAPGGSAERDFNCVVEINGQKIRGFGLGSVRSGRPNGWGLYNLVGNVQEWVKTGDGWSARGGAFNDPISQCNPNLSRPGSGSADATTGFRLVRELR